MQQAARELARIQCPLHTFAFGLPRDKSQARDVAVVNFVDHRTVFVKNELSLTGMIEVQGYVNQQVPVELVVEDSSGSKEVIGPRMVTATEDGQQLGVEIDYIPQAAGQYKLTLRAAEQPGELVTQNNELSAFLTVLQGGLKVLYLEGELRYEYKFLCRSIDASADIQLDARWIDHRLRKRWPVEAVEQFANPEYDVFILGDLDSAALGEKNLEALAKAVEGGKGLIMVGGYHSFGPGGYAKTVLADVLPVKLDTIRQPFDSPILTQLHIDGPLQMVPATDRHITRLAGGSGGNAAAWARLKPLTGANRFLELKPRATLLAETPNRVPLLVAGEYQAGRVLAFAGDSTWQWRLQGTEAQTAHQRFWRQVILWLARRDEAEEEDVWVKLAQRRFHPRSRVAFTAGVQSAAGDAVQDAVLSAEVVLPDGSRQKARLSAREGRITGAFDQTEATGDYLIQVTAVRDGTTIGTAETKFLVFDQDLELSDPSARPDQLAALSAITAEAGGKSWPAEQLPELLRQIQQRPPEMEISVPVRWQLADTWQDATIFLLLIVGLLTAEWFLRKKWALV